MAVPYDLVIVKSIRKTSTLSRINSRKALKISTLRDFLLWSDSLVANDHIADLSDTARPFHLLLGGRRSVVDARET